MTRDTLARIAWALALSAHVPDHVASAQPSAHSVSGSVVVSTQDGRVRADHSDVVVFLERLDGTTVGAPRPTPPAVSQRGQVFSPHVLVVTAGTRVDFPNDDTVFHNVFSLSRPRPFDLDVYAQGEVRSVDFPRTGLVKVYCNIHPEMASFILVLDSDLYALSSATGAFTIRNVPDGAYRLRTWNEFGGEHTDTLTVSAGDLDVRVLEIQETRRAVPHTNKFGQPYSRKY